jgi:peroxiredoxin
MDPVRSLALLALLAAGSLACGQPSLADVAVGEPAPAFALRDLDGREVSLASFAGKTVVLEWMNPNCPYSRRHADHKTMPTTAARHPEAVWLGIDSTNPSSGDHLDAAAWKTYLAERGIGYPVLADPTGATGRAYGAKTTPHMYVIDGQGKLAYAGAIDDDPRGRGAKVNYVDAALTALAAGRTPDPATTPPYGCTVKY